MNKLLIVLALIINSFWASGQEKTTDSLPFSLEDRLLVFKASINGEEIDFAFDTGASIGLSNSTIVSRAGLIVKNGSQSINDANLKKIKIKNTLIQKMQIGSLVLENIKGVVYDMEFLTCHKFYLLGMDVIGRLNWKIDFKQKLIFVSKKPFPTNETTIEIPVSNATNRPKTSLTINGINYPNCLIDLGYSGSIEIPENSNLNMLHQQLLGKGKTQLGLSSNMSVSGLGQADTVKSILLDKIQIGQSNFSNTICSIHEKTNFKIGLGFFSTQTTIFILNHSEGKYYIEPNHVSEKLPLPLDARVSYQDGKLVITGLNLNKNSSTKMLTIGETIKSINGKQASEFNDNCQFLLEYYHYKKPFIQIEKIDGTIVTIKRSDLM
jgi:hypothetical protein